jgi:hypothetical protein
MGIAAGIHVGDLDGSAASDQSRWSAAVEVTVHDSSHIPLNGATVTGTWSTDGSSGSCTTGGAGTCTVVLAGLQQSDASTTFTVTAVTTPGRTYDPSANHDDDWSSNGTTIALTKHTKY